MIKHVGRLIWGQIEKLIAIAIPGAPAAPLLVTSELNILGFNLMELTAFRAVNVVILLLVIYIHERITGRAPEFLNENSRRSFRQWVAAGLSAATYKIPIFWTCTIGLEVLGWPIATHKVVLLSFVYIVENVVFVGGLSSIIMSWLRHSLPRILGWLRLQYNVFPKDK
ncbi:MAG: hypothetical protein AAB738_01595 [Patescibacteria group bacterium]